MYTSFDLLRYIHADFAGSKTDRKSASGTCQFLGHSLVSWFSKKQSCVALYTIEVEYIVVGLYCAQILWMRQTLKNYGVQFDTTSRLCDNTAGPKTHHSSSDDD